VIRENVPFELFLFKKNRDHISSVSPECGPEFNWFVDAENSKPGDLIIRLKERLEFQIDSATTRFKTADGITMFDSPEDVRRWYKGFQAYVLDNYTT
jgi:hypothetical protein